MADILDPLSKALYIIHYTRCTMVKGSVNDRQRVLWDMCDLDVYTSYCTTNALFVAGNTLFSAIKYQRANIGYGALIL